MPHTDPQGWFRQASSYGGVKGCNHFRCWFSVGCWALLDWAEVSAWILRVVPASMVVFFRAHWHYCPAERAAFSLLAVLYPDSFSSQWEKCQGSQTWRSVKGVSWAWYSQSKAAPGSTQIDLLCCLPLWKGGHPHRYKWRRDSELPFCPR